MNENITFLENLLKENPRWGVMRKWSLQCHINQLKGVPVPPHPLEGQPSQPIKTNTEKKHLKEIKELKEQVNFWSNTAQNYLKSLQKTTAELDQAKENIKLKKERE